MTEITNTDVPIIFIHPDSAACDKLVKIIPKDTKVQYINISTMTSIPAEITSIPCLVIKGKELYCGKKAFDYFNKNDEFDYVNLCGKNGKCSFTLLENDEDENLSNGLFSSINENGMSEGVPKYDEQNTSNMDLDKLEKNRASEYRPISRE